jgi:hypothetical protein
MTICDGCGQPADANHTKGRIERLQMATRFRPVHIHTLVIDSCPPPTLSDFFYNLGEVRTAVCRAYFDELAKCAGGTGAAAADAEAVLTEFQRRGLFLAYAVDCSIADPAVLSSAVEKSLSTLKLRLNTSYRPKFVAMVSQPTSVLIAPLQAAGWSEKLLLDGTKPFSGAGFGEKLNQAIASAH